MPAEAKRIIDMLKFSGFEAYAVGGCVRDSLMGKRPDDWDIATSAKPDEMKAVFAEKRCIDTGLKHGTLTVIENGMPFEITAFRLDGEYEDNRHPKSVIFTASLEEDLSRRDFTVNAMAYDPQKGVADPFGGREDIERKIIRCVGDPDRRFNEDALRILRALRFASVLDFEIEENTAKSILENRTLLKNISSERIAKELLRLLCGEGVRRVLMDFAPVLFEIIPELAPMYKNGHDNPHHCYDIYEHTLVTVENISAVPELRLAMLLHDCGKPAAKTYKDCKAHFYGHQKISTELAEGILRRLKLSNKMRDKVLFLVENHDLWALYEKPESMQRYLSEFGEDRVLRLLEVMRADVLAQAPEYRYREAQIKAAEENARALTAANGRITLATLAVNGKTLMENGIPQGREMGRILNALLEEVLDGKLENKKEKLLKRAEELV